jgi:selenide,water dikinase
VRNWDSYGAEVTLADGLENWQRDVLADPQTSGGLLIAAAPDGADAVLAQLRAAGFGRAAVIGEMVSGSPRIFAHP